MRSDFLAFFFQSLKKITQNNLLSPLSVRFAVHFLCIYKMSLRKFQAMASL